MPQASLALAGRPAVRPSPGAGDRPGLSTTYRYVVSNETPDLTTKPKRDDLTNILVRPVFYLRFDFRRFQSRVWTNLELAGGP